jgi:photosystem II stability/assembly factor-like uncharacterized protein
MTKSHLYWFVVFVSLLSVFGTGCRSNARQPGMGKLSSHENVAAVGIDDATWKFDLVEKLPDERTQRRIRCNKDRLCWVWDKQSIWIGEGVNPWRQFCTTPSGQNKDANLNSVYLESSQIGWIVQGHALYKTEDGGCSLRRVSVPELEGGMMGTIMSVSFVDKDHGWIVGGRFEPLRKDDPKINTEITRGQIRTACMFQTLDGGASWNLQNLPRLIGSFDEVNFWENEIGLASSRSHVVFTNDGGKVWTDMARHFPRIENERGAFESAIFLDRSNGWLLFSGFEFEALATISEGKSWSRAIWRIESQSSDTSSLPPPPRFVFVDKSHGLFVYNHLYGGELFKTANAGKTWEQVTPDRSKDEVFYDLVFQKGSGGFLVSSKAIYAFNVK